MCRRRWSSGGGNVAGIFVTPRHMCLSNFWEVANGNGKAIISTSINRRNFIEPLERFTNRK